MNGARSRKRQKMNNSIIGRILTDSDMMLILAVAYILYSQNADMKVILALLSVLL